MGYLFVLISLGALLYGDFWFFLKTLAITFISMVAIALFLPKASGNVVASDNSKNWEKPADAPQEPCANPDYKTIKYDEDNTCDNFYMQREDEYREEYGDDFEDAIQDGWEERHRERL